MARLVPAALTSSTRVVGYMHTIHVSSIQQVGATSVEFQI